MTLLFLATLARAQDPEPAVLDVVVIGRDAADELRDSAQAVTVIEVDRAGRQSADLGEVVARAPGVGVRRDGGLGSGSRISLNGLTDEQIRFFLDGVPLELAGWPLGLPGVPVGLLTRVEVYEGVVPVRFGADALGGAINLVSDAEPGGGLSYQGGSFDTHRLAAHARLERGIFRLRTSAFADAAANDYAVDVEVPDAVGRPEPATVRRFHDAYSAAGGSLELGVADRPWADDLSLRGFASQFDKEIQHKVGMTVPYGEPVYGVDTVGGTLTWKYAPIRAFDVHAWAGATWTKRTFQDLATCVYDWFGRCVDERAQPGEISVPATDRVVRDLTPTGRIAAMYRLSDAHAITLAVSPTAFTRAGDDLRSNGPERDPLTARRDALQVVTGLEHAFEDGRDRLANLAFVKHYAQRLASEEPLAGGGFRDLNRSSSRFGAGDGLRVQLAPWILAKASWEYATRLPAPDEVFGDAVRVLDNLELAPETSQNANFELAVDVGNLTVDAGLFVRSAQDLIVLLGADDAFSYVNVFGARSVGGDVAVGWTSPGEHVALSANATRFDLRNTSEEGAFGAFAGDRIPNRPWLFANATASLGADDVAAAGDRLSLDWYTRYVHGFYRGWESVGLVQFKQTVPAQLSHTVAATWSTDRVSTSVEVQNVTDAALFDDFGVQRPGRSVFAKLALTY